MNRGMAIAVMAGGCLLAGCGGADTEGRVPVYPVSGTLTMFGKPVDGATVAFAPQEGQPTAVGKTDKDGNFQLTTYDYQDGAAAGRFNAVISLIVAKNDPKLGDGDDHEAQEEANSTHDAEGEGGDVEMVPELYTNATDTPFQFEVKTTGENEFTLAIE